MDDLGFKIVLIGDSNVGKTSIVYWLMYQKHCMTDVFPTIGTAFNTRTIEIDNRQIKLQLWDTAGQERFRSIAKIYYRGSYGCLCVFDVMDKDSFTGLKQWIEEYKNENNGIDYTILLIANKIDFPETEWDITREEILEYAMKQQCKCFFTSCMTGRNVNNAFEHLTKRIIEQHHITSEKYKKISEKPGSAIQLLSYPPPSSIKIPGCHC